MKLTSEQLDASRFDENLMLTACPGSLTSRELYDSVQVLLASQGGDGGFHGSPDSLGPRPFVYDVPILTTIYSVWALARARDLLSGRGEEANDAMRPRVSAQDSGHAWIAS